MDQSLPATAILPKRTQAQRQQDLQEVLTLPEGYRYVATLYRHHFAGDRAALLPEPQEMIARILSREYPGRSERDAPETACRST